MDPAIEHVFILAAYVTLVGLPLGLAAGWGVKQLVGLHERLVARQQFERLALAKLKVLDTAVALGTERRELAELDERLERAIGADSMGQLLAVESGSVPAENQARELAHGTQPR